MTTHNLLIATDLDGTLLDHDSYDWGAASPSLELLKQNNIPLIIVTSKTSAEVSVLRQKIGCRHPYIVENGSAFVIPEGYLEGEEQHIVLGRPYAEIEVFLSNVREEHGFSFKSYADADLEQIADWTGLTLPECGLSANRIASIPLVWNDNDEHKRLFASIAKNSGFQLLQGGRFMHVGGITDKGKALAQLIDLLRQNGQDIKTVIGLGDSQNDLAFLAECDYPIWVRKVHGSTPETDFWQNAQCTLKRGPAGWNDAVGDIVKRLL